MSPASARAPLREWGIFVLEGILYVAILSTIVNPEVTVSTGIVTRTSDPRDPTYPILLRPDRIPAREGPCFQQHIQPSDIPAVIDSAGQSPILAVDFETRGGDYSTDIEVVGIGLAWDRGSVYLTVRSSTDGGRSNLTRSDCLPEQMESLWKLLLNHPGLIAHNVYFDGGVIRKLTGEHANWKSCTYALLAHLRNEGFPGIAWGLKNAMVEFLGWEESNEHDLEEWLVVHGYYRGTPRKDSSPEYLAEQYRQGLLRPERGEMWRVPQDILGKYCVLDAEGCYLLYTEVLQPVMENFPGLQKYMDMFMHSILLHVDQKIRGVLVDRDGLRNRHEELLAGLEQMEKEFRLHPDVAGGVLELEEEMLQPLLDSAPARLKKDGDVSKNYIKWEQRVVEASTGKLDAYRFNLASGDQLRKLFYEKLGHSVRITTESGLPGTSGKALRAFGESGKLLIQYNDYEKELGYIEDYMERTADRETIHPSFRMPGTSTGRLSGKEPNWQQIPKTDAVMRLFHARPGYTWVDIDFAALEAVVVTEFSQDRNMLLLYADNAPTNDIHLFVAAHTPGLREPILAAGYDPAKPTPEGVSNAKKLCKKQRNIAKTVVYACQYGAGVRKVHSQLTEDGVDISYEEVEVVHKTYWDLFAGVRDFGRELFYEWKRNGYIVNGTGRPLAVPEILSKDLLNRFIQSTGHDLLTHYIYIYTAELDRQEIEWYPVVVDLHDATTVEVREEDADRVVGILNWSMDELNRQLGGNIKLRGKPVVGRNMSQVKETEE